MPEGPEIKRSADKLAQVLAGQTCEKVHFGLPHLSIFSTQLNRQTITYVKPRAKAMLIGFASGHVIYSHNQLYGKWVTLAPGQSYNTNRQLRIALKTTRGEAHLYSASDIEVLDEKRLHLHPFLAKLGPDILDEATTDEVIRVRLDEPKFQRRALGSLLLDQSFVAGTGNYIRSEVLFLANLHPLRRLVSLSNTERETLAECLSLVATRSYREKGICVSDPIKNELKQVHNYYEYYRFAVFGHENRPCVVCTTPVEKRMVSGRRLYLCPRCQPV